MNFPKYTSGNKTGRNGFNLLSMIVEDELGWIVRKNHQEDDFGIDAYIDVVFDGYVTGKSISIQIKSGDSYFRELDESHWNFYGEKKHLNYYLNQENPLIIVLVDLRNKIAYWEAVKIEYINLLDNSWTMAIPKQQQISLNQKDMLLEHVSNTVDYVSQLESYWQGNLLLSESGRLCIVAGKEDIENFNYQPLIDLIDRVCSNKHHFSKFKENIEIGIHGFDDDSRELYEIPEVSNWITNIFSNVSGLSYFLANDIYGHFLKIFTFCIVENKIVTKDKENSRMLVEFDTIELQRVFNILFADLNSFTAFFNLSDDVNKQISENLILRIGGNH